MTYAISSKGLALIRKFEGFRSQPAPLPGGAWVVGYGHVRVGEPGKPVSRKAAAELLARDLAPLERLVNALVSKPLTQSQFDALASFAFSIGEEAFAASQVLRWVNSGDFVAAACGIAAWRKGDLGGECGIVDTLVHRRAAEKALFLKGVPFEAAPSALLRSQLDHAAAILGATVKQATAPPPGEDNVVSMLSKVQPKFEPAALRLTEILKSEPATDAALQRQAANDFVAICEDEIVTAYAKPVARPLVVRPSVAARTKRPPVRSGARGAIAKCVGALARLRVPRWIASLDHVGLCGLLLSGIGLMSIAGSLLFSGPDDLIEIAFGVALVAPGLAAVLLAVWGLWRAPRTV